VFVQSKVRNGEYLRWMSFFLRPNVRIDGRMAPSGRIISITTADIEKHRRVSRGRRKEYLTRVDFFCSAHTFTSRSFQVQRRSERKENHCVALTILLKLSNAQLLEREGHVSRFKILSDERERHA